MSITATEQAEVDRANSTEATPIVLVHGLWLLPGSWQPWRELAEAQGFVTLAPGWPDDPATVETARAHPETLAGKSVGAVTDHFAEVIGALDRKPVVIGHSFGGLITQKLAGRRPRPRLGGHRPGTLPRGAPAAGLGAQGVLGGAGQPGQLQARRDADRGAVALRVRQRRPAGRVRRALRPLRRACPGRPLFQAATANLNPRTEAAVDTLRTDRGPLLVVSGEKDNTVPWAIANASYKKQARNADPTEITEMAGRGHSLVIDHGWPEVADTALAFLGKHGVTATAT